MNTELAVIIICYAITILVGIYLFRKDNTKPVIEKPIDDYDTLINILNLTIKTEIEYKYKLDYKLKDIRVIYDFKGDMEALTKKIMSSFSPTYLRQLEFYHSRDYIIKYVARNVEIFLIEYTRQNKIKTH